jgi:hypothetical protein
LNGRREEFKRNAGLAIVETSQATEHASENGATGREYDSVRGEFRRILDTEHEICTVWKFALGI